MPARDLRSQLAEITRQSVTAGVDQNPQSILKARPCLVGAARAFWRFISVVTRRNQQFRCQNEVAEVRPAGQANPVHKVTTAHAPPSKS